MSDHRPMPSPLGVPISLRVRVPTGQLFAPARRALEAIASVHGDGALPALPVSRSRGGLQVGTYEWNDRTGDPIRLSFSAASSHPELSVVHEVGHFLDHQGLGRPGSFASEAGAIPDLMRVIDETAAVTLLRLLRSSRRVLVEVRGRREVETINGRLVGYLLEPKELFARAYAQYIAQASRDPILLEQLVRLRSTRQAAVYHDTWTDEDFEPVARQIERLFRRMRWMTSR